MDTKHQAGLEGLHYAAEKGLPVVVMEPLRGGALAEKLPAGVMNAYNSFPVKRSPAEWSFRWLIDIKEVVSVLSGVSTMEQLEENIRIFSETEPACMTSDEKALIDKVKEEFMSTSRVSCTRCGYCMPCPAGVNIPEVFQSYNDAAHKAYREHAVFMYRSSVVQQDRSGADRCVECGLCEPSCPQSIPIMAKLKEAHQALIR
jgi:predicted aldo/keto reductase-like oxidoreductase